MRRGFAGMSDRRAIFALSEEKVIVAGFDEAGYGPRLGPLGLRDCLVHAAPPFGLSRKKRNPLQCEPVIALATAESDL